MKKFLSILVLLSISHFSSADCTTDRCTTTVDRVYPTGTINGGVYIIPAGSLAGIGCTPLGGIYFTMPKSHTVFDETYSLLLTALVTQKEVTIRIIEGTDSCEVAYVYIDN